MSTNFPIKHSVVIIFKYFPYQITSHFQTYGYTAFTSDSTQDENRFATKILYFDAFVGGVLTGAMKGTVLFAASYNLTKLIQ